MTSRERARYRLERGVGARANARVRRRDRVRRMARRLRERQNERRRASPRRKRKVALALSASAMAVTTGGMTFPDFSSQSTTVSQLPGAGVRQPAALLEVSDAMKQALIEEEGVRYTVYRDVAGYPTVGVGHLVKAGDGLSVGQRISEERALAFLEADLEHAEAAVERLVGDLPLHQHEFDALVDLVFNVGEGNVSPDASPYLNMAIKAGNYTAIAAELEYHQAGEAVAPGLVERSERRTAIFLDGNYENPRESA